MNARARRAQRHVDEHGPTDAPYETADSTEEFEVDTTR